MPDLPWYVYAMLLAPLGLILFAAAYKSLQVRAAREWPSAAGKVVVSNAELRKVRVIDSDREDGHRFEERNFANIVYEYAVAGKKLRNNRVSIGEDLGNFEVPETIAKYPVGMAVTVYYNPLHPNEAVLERDLPKGLWGCLGIGTAVVLAIVFGSAFGLHRFTDFLSTRLNDPKLSVLVVALGGFGFVISLFALALQKQSSLAKKWPVVTGTIKLSDIEQYRAAPTENRLARAGHVPAQGELHLQLQQPLLHQHACEPCQQRRVDVGLAGAQVHDGVSGRCFRQGLCQPGQSRRGDAGAGHRVCVGVGSSLPASGWWRITSRRTVR